MQIIEQNDVFKHYICPRLWVPHHRGFFIISDGFHSIQFWQDKRRFYLCSVVAGSIHFSAQISRDDMFFGACLMQEGFCLFKLPRRGDCTLKIKAQFRQFRDCKTAALSSEFLKDRLVVLGLHNKQRPAFALVSCKQKQVIRYLHSQVHLQVYKFNITTFSQGILHGNDNACIQTLTGTAFTIPISFGVRTSAIVPEKGAATVARYYARQNKICHNKLTKLPLDYSELVASHSGKFVGIVSQNTLQIVNTKTQQITLNIEVSPIRHIEFNFADELAVLFSDGKICVFRG